MADPIVNNEAVLKALRQLVENVENMRPALMAIGEVLIYSSKQRFATKTGPDGQRWTDNSEVTKWTPKKNPGGGEWIKGRNDPLVGESHQLSEQIFYNLIGDDELEIGSPMKYAAMQQFGGSKSEFPFLWGDIPARAFLGISDSDERQILDIVGDHISGKF